MGAKDFVSIDSKIQNWDLQLAIIVAKQLAGIERGQQWYSLCFWESFTLRPLSLRFSMRSFNETPCRSICRWM